MIQTRTARVAPEKAVFRPVLPFVILPGFTEKQVDITPIETAYNGYKFRSRLEARWAVFFDESAIDYEYELEGFELGDSGTSYLPDFYLETMKIHVEVKPNKELSDAEIRKLVLFAADGGMPLLLILGSPGNEEMLFLSRRSLPSWSEVITWKEEASSLSEAFLGHVGLYCQVEFGQSALVPGWTLLYAPGDLKDLVDSRIKRARQAASQARFEFGQTPIGPRDGSY